MNESGKTESQGPGVMCSVGSYAITKCMDMQILLKPKKIRSVDMTLTFGIIDTKYDLVIGQQDI